MKTIFDEMNLNSLTLKNRIFRSATWEGLADSNGNLNEPLYEIYRELATGGVGAIITGITTISPHDALIDGIVQFYSDKFIDQHKKLTDLVHESDAKIFLQAAIVDSVFNIGDELYDIPINKLSVAHIEEVIELFEAAAVRAKIAGYDGLQIHAAHYFFLSKFISPKFNNRNDEYDGTPARRAKILGDILDAIRNAVGKDFCITAKINGDDFTDDGLTINDFINACEVMKVHGVDAVEVSGNYTSRDAKAYVNEAYFKTYAVELRKRVDIPVILVGGNRSIEKMNQLLNETEIEFLSMSRSLIREPNLINRWKNGDISQAKCVSCNACYRTPAHKCIFNLRGH